MHGTVPSPVNEPLQPGGLTADLRLALRLAIRDLRGGLRGFGVFIACLALGVAAIAMVASASRGLTEGLSRDGRRILGGDLAIGLIQREATGTERAAFDALGKVTTVTTLRAMAIAGEKGSALVELKAVDENYPSEGLLATAPQLEPRELFANRNGAFGAVVDSVLLARLGLVAGDIITIGNARIQLRAALVAEPDKVASGVGFGPRLILSQDALTASGLLQPGALVRWTYRLILPDAARDDGRVAEVQTQLKSAFPEAGFEFRSRGNAAPQFQRSIDRFTQFLTLVGLTALLVGGVGVANAVRRFVDVKRTDFATLKALGAPGGQVVLIHFLEVMGVALIGIAIGLAIGASTPYLLAALLRDLLPVPFEPTIAFGELALAALYGLLTAAVFSILPLGRAHDVPVSALFRDKVEPDTNWPRRIYLVLFVLALGALIASAVLFAYNTQIALLYVGIIAVVFVGLRGLSWGLMRGARAFPRATWPTARMAIANIHRPGALTPALVLSLGLGVALLSTLAFIDVSLSRSLKQDLPTRAPSFFFLDIPNPDVPRFEAFMVQNAQSATLDRVPMMRGRVVALKDIRAEDFKAPEQAAWILEGDRGITYANSPPLGSVVVEGEWWQAGHGGTNLVSFDQQIGKDLGLSIGDSVTVNVLGRNVTARIANFRKVEWRRIGINFVMVFSPNTFAGAPHTHLATATYADGKTDSGRDATLLRALAKDFPNVTAVRVKEALDAVNDVVGKLTLAIRGASLIAIIASLLVLAGALAAGQRARLYDAVILKTLGATRVRLIGAYALEYGLIGLASALFGLAAGAIASWLVVTRVMNLQFAFEPLGAVLAAGGAVSIAIIFGLAGTARVLAQKPAQHLRSL
jgi:putative ABC transport system permease protein